MPKKSDEKISGIGIGADGQEWIKAVEVAERTGLSKVHISKLAALGHLTRNSDFFFPWPQVQEQIRVYDENRKHQRGPRVTQRDAESLDIAEEDVFNTSALEHVLEELRKGQSEHAAGLAMHYGKAIKILVDSKMAQLDLLVKEGKAVSRKLVEDWLFSVSKNNRDAWLNWPQQVAAEMGQRLGVDPRLMNDVLMEHVRKQLERNSTLPLDCPFDAVEGVPEGTDTAP